VGYQRVKAALRDFVRKILGNDGTGSLGVEGFAQLVEGLLSIRSAFYWDFAVSGFLDSTADVEC
jgi:hypothetical protein